MIHTYKDMKKEQLANLLGSLAIAVSDAQNEAMAVRTSLNASEMAAVMTLGTSPGLSIDHLGKILGLSHSATVRLVAKLAAQGQIARRPRADRREVGLRLTAKGRGLRDRLVTARGRVLEGCIASLPAAERVAFGRLVSTLLETLTASRRQADHICRLCDETVCPLESCPVERKAVRLETGAP